MSGSGLDALRDVQGVLGGFFANRAGQLVATSMPTFFDREELDALIPRMAAVVAGGGEVSDDELEHYVLRFRDYHFHLRPESHGMLYVMSEPNTNLPALRMACRLVARRVGRAPSTIPATPAAKEERASLIPPETEAALSTTPRTPAFPPALMADSPEFTPTPSVPRSSGSPESRTMPHAPNTTGKSILYRGRLYKV